MYIKTQLNEILSKKMDREDFLKNITIGIVALTGFRATLHLLSQQQPKIKMDDIGYGGSAYGGDDAAKLS
jgi:hypothetical protein